MGSSGLGIDIRLNPVVSLVSAQIIWGFVPWCIYNQTVDSEFYDGRVEDMDHCYLYLDVHWYPRRLGCKYGNMKLGKPNEKPEFKDATYFTMLFAAGYVYTSY